MRDAAEGMGRSGTDVVTTARQRSNAGDNEGAEKRYTKMVRRLEEQWTGERGKA